LATQFVGNLPAEAYNTQGETIQEQAKAVLNQVGGYLNIQTGSGYVFSGSKTTTPPFNLNGLPDPGTLTTSVGVAPPNGYYEGDAVVAKATIDNNVTLSYGITAANPSIEQFVRVLNYLANAPPFNPASSTDVANVTQATAQLNQSVQQLQTLEGTVSLQQGQLSSTLTTQQNALAIAKGNISNIESVDPATAITQLDTLQTQLEASYQAVSMISQLSLVNYLK
jgi:flagellar hook-associated protein 3 FlgL